MERNRILRRLAALLLAFTLLTIETSVVFADASGTDAPGVSSGDIADVSGTDASDSDASDSDVSDADISSADAPVDLYLGTVKAKAALLVDMDTLEILYEQNADEPLPPASTTKIMTALLVMEAVESGQLTLDEVILPEQQELASIPWDASTITPKIATGETLRVLDYLYSVMLSSDCAACNVLARRVSGSVDAFVERMNSRAAELGCEGTNFLNTHGYPKEGHAASARTMYLITQEALKYPVFCDIVASRSYTIPATNKNAERKLTNTNSLLVGASEYNYLYATGVKTGYSKSSGYCLVTTAENSGRNLLAVILGAEKPTVDGKPVYEHFTESKRLLEWGFHAFTWQTIANAGFSATQVPLSGGELDYLTLVYADSAVSLLPVDFDMESLDVRINLRMTSAAAPVMKGTNFGTASIYRGDKLLAEIPLVAGADTPVKKMVDNTVLYLVIGGGVLAIACLGMAIKQAGSRRGGYGYDPVPDPSGDPETYRYGDRPLYKRRGRGGPVGQPTYYNGQYYTQRPQQDEDYYDYEEYRRERERNRYADRTRDDRPPAQPGPIFPRNWTPPNGKRQ